MTDPLLEDPPSGSPPDFPELLIVTGMSGAGRSTAANALEDLGWFVVDNLPPALLPRLVELAARANGGVPRIAAVVDIRAGSFFQGLSANLSALGPDFPRPRVLFLEASDDVLVRRFESSRRPHPLQADGRILDGIGRERELLRDMRGEAEIVIDTTGLNVHQLAARVAADFAGAVRPRLRATVMSFGYKYGLPVDADLVVDCRFLPNPHWVPELRPLTGEAAAVKEYVLSQPGALEFVERYADVVRIVSAGYQREGKRHVTLAVGCTGGKHRSVAIAGELAGRLAADGIDVNVVHRDAGRE